MRPGLGSPWVSVKVGAHPGISVAAEVQDDPFAPGLGGFMVAFEVSAECSLSEGTYSIPFTVTDPDGNTSSATLFVHVRGNQPPQRSPSHLHGEATVTLTPGGIVRSPVVMGPYQIWDPDGDEVRVEVPGGGAPVYAANLSAFLGSLTVMYFPNAADEYCRAVREKDVIADDFTVTWCGRRRFDLGEEGDNTTFGLIRASWRWQRRGKRAMGVLVVVALAVGVGGELSSASFPPGVEELLPQAVVLREVAVIEPLAPEGFALLGFHDLNHDGWLDLVVAGDRRVQVMFGDGRGGFSPGPWVYLEVEEYEEGAQIPGRTVMERGETCWEPYELEEREGKLFAPVQVFVHTGVMVDLDDDGILDLVVRGSGGSKEEWGLRLYLLRGLGEGKFARAGSLLYPKGLYISGLWAVEGEVLFTVAERDEPTRLYRLSAPEGLESPRLEKLAEGP